MEDEPLDTEKARMIALEEGLKAFVALDALRLQMLNDAVDWLEEMTDLDKMEIRKQLAYRRGYQVASKLGTIKAVRLLLQE